MDLIECNWQPEFRQMAELLGRRWKSSVNQKTSLEKAVNHSRAMMDVSLTNDGPVTFVIDSEVDEPKA
eukprot:scaffold295693_cov15-Tisochrysis_lutea.AAC.1